LASCSDLHLYFCSDFILLLFYRIQYFVIDEEVLLGYKQKGIEGLLDVSKRPHNTKYKKITPEVEETILDLRLTKRFGCNRIKFRLKRIIGISLSTRTIYKILKRHCLNILKCQTKVRRYKRFAMKHPNDMVQLDILGPFYLSNSSQRNYIISCLDDCSRKVSSKWSERKRSVDVLNVLEDWIMISGKPKMMMHDNGKQFTSIQNIQTFPGTQPDKE